MRELTFRQHTSRSNICNWNQHPLGQRLCSVSIHRKTFYSSANAIPSEKLVVSRQHLEEVSLQLILS